ncbi:MAG TPA: integrase core domain-containing protein [Lacipirellulaceae bacterium]|nr:integrase core domain-containing protein [Lacipirellulaceae bacterium]
MGWLVQPLLFFLARCTRNQLIRNIEFLKTENEMLRKRVPNKHIHLKADERDRLLKLALAIGPDVKHLVSIVTYDTIRRWRRKACGFVSRGPVGRPKKPMEIRALVVKIARETGWGYTRVLGELRKLNIHDISRQTVVNILKANGHNPNSRRGPGSWDELLKMHAETLWQCDFFSKRVFSKLGFPQLFAMVFLNVATRRVWVSPATRNPTEDWVEQQAKAFIEYASANDLKIDLVTRDNDQIYKKGFDRVMTEAGSRPRRLALRSPNLNAYVERFIQTLQVECLDHFLVFGEKHFDHLVKEYVEHYHTERPHQGLHNRLVNAQPPPCSTGELHCRTRLGGLLKHYYRQAA